MVGGQHWCALYVVILEKGLPDTIVQGYIDIETGQPITLKLKKEVRRARAPRKPKPMKVVNPAAEALTTNADWRIKHATTKLVIHEVDWQVNPFNYDIMNLVNLQSGVPELSRSANQYRCPACGVNPVNPECYAWVCDECCMPDVVGCLVHGDNAKVFASAPPPPTRTSRPRGAGNTSTRKRRRTAISGPPNPLLYHRAADHHEHKIYVWRCAYWGHSIFSTEACNSTRQANREVIVCIVLYCIV